MGLFGLHLELNTIEFENQVKIKKLNSGRYCVIKYDKTIGGGLINIKRLFTGTEKACEKYIIKNKLEDFTWG